MRTFGYLILLLVMGIAVGAELPTIKLAIGGGHDEFTMLMVALVLISISYFAVLVVRRSVFRLTREVVVFLGVTSLLGYISTSFKRPGQCWFPLAASSRCLPASAGEC